MKRFVIDTHPLLWYLTSDQRLGSGAKGIMEKAEHGKVEMILPSIVLVEAIDVISKGRVDYDTDELLGWVDGLSHCKPRSLDLDIIKLYKEFSSKGVELDAHDKIIVVTAKLFGDIPVVTKDSQIQEVFATIW